MKDKLDLFFIQKFCETGDLTFFNKILDEKDKEFFIGAAKFILKKFKNSKKHEKGVKIAKLLVPVVTKSPDKITVSPPKGVNIPKPPNADEMCHYYAKNKLSDDDRKERWIELLHQTKKIPDNFDILVVDYLKIAFDAIDKIYFHGVLWKYIWSHNSTLELTVNNKLTTTAGRCNVTGCSYSINMASKIFASMFKSGQKLYIGMGLPCYTRKECFLSTLQHEIIHLLLFRFCSNKMAPSDWNSHSDHFKMIVFNLFGQTDIKHDFLERLNKTPGPTTGPAKDPTKVIKDAALTEAEIKQKTKHIIKIGDIINDKFILKKFNPKKLFFVGKTNASFALNIPYRFFYINYDPVKKYIGIKDYKIPEPGKGSNLTDAEIKQKIKQTMKLGDMINDRFFINRFDAKYIGFFSKAEGGRAPSWLEIPYRFFYVNYDPIKKYVTGLHITDI